ncbi:hypothetical protein EDE05_11439 [Neorhizobium sp. R1-B]|jgi:hypothetical protein|uniref:hypothetical protein n=1 Tax=unclassified Neorhizobium TaxID=2629175 RepID=UPI000DD686AB|nr:MULTISPECIES: hypothetical protein [unclassified Neorhizobium]TCV61733.1 hypothetical protein EDE09_1251 [Neorhizobium sp. S3-V5DH]TDX77730.1 hypothetical protein EDE05_11439 [Neorhizobium sp. R1-B]
MGSRIWKSIAFVAPLSGLALLMGFGEQIDEGACSGTLAFEKSRQLLEERPEVLDIAPGSFRWEGDCRFAMQGYADVATAGAPSRRTFELLVALEPGSHRWQEVSFSMGD